MRPLKFGTFFIQSAIRNTDEFNMFIFDFRPTSNINAYNDATTAGRIYIEFPTVSADSVS